MDDDVDIWNTVNHMVVKFILAYVLLKNWGWSYVKYNDLFPSQFYKNHKNWAKVKVV